MSGGNSLRNDLFLFFKTVAVEITIQSKRINKDAEKILKSKPPPAPPAKEPPNVWMVFLITLGVIVLLGALIIGPVFCCLKKRGAFSSEHVDEDIDFPDEDEEQRSPKQLAVSPARALSPARPGLSPAAKSPKSPRPVRTPRNGRTPTKRGGQPRGLSPMGLSPMKNRSY